MPCEEPSGHWTTREAVQLIELERTRPIFQCLQDTGQQNPQEGGQGGRDERPSVLPEGVCGWQTGQEERRKAET